MKRTKSGRTGGGSLLALLGIMAVLAGCQGSEAEGAPEVAPLSIGTESIVVVVSDAIHSGPVVSGTLLPERSAIVRAETGGSVLTITADEGQAVTAGQVLARINDDAVQDAFLSAQSGVRSAQNSLEIAQREVARAERLVAGGAIAPRDLELARNQAAAAQTQVADALSRQAQAARQLEATRVRAPLAGIVSERAINAGDVVSPGSALFTVIDPSRMRLEASVPSDQLGALQVGAPVEFEVRGYTGVSFRGTIERINPAADPVTRQIAIYVSVPNVGGRLVAGLFAEGQVQNQSRTAMVVPTEAVNESGADASVVRLRAGVTEVVPVEVGVRDRETERIEILSGIAVGDTLLIGAARGITPGTPVRVGSAATAGAGAPAPTPETEAGAGTAAGAGAGEAAAAGAGASAATGR